MPLRGSVRLTRNQSMEPSLGIAVCEFFRWCP